MKNIFGTRKELTPYDFPKYVEYQNRILMSPWSHFEVSMDPDVVFWKNKADAKDKRIIANLFKAFTLAEGGVEDYWRTIVAKKFNYHEIVDLATSCAHQEVIHKRAYAQVEESLEIDSGTTITLDPIANKKLDEIVNNRLLSSEIDTKNLLLSLATFSGAIEGISLFSSFAVLLWFCKSGKLTSFFQILTWSVLDEELHSQIGISLFKDVAEQFPESLPSQREVEEAFDYVVNNEVAFLRDAFRGANLNGINEEIAIDFLYHRANKKLKELGYIPTYNCIGTHRVLSDYFYTNILGDLDTDFFVYGRNGQGYSAMVRQKFDSPNLEKYSYLCR